MKLIYEKPKVYYWSAERLDNIIAKMSGGGGSILNRIILSTSYIEIEKNELFPLEVENSIGTILSSPEVSWISINPQIAQVEQSGVVSGVKAGQTQIVVSRNNLKAYCTVKVSNVSENKVYFINNLYNLMGLSITEGTKIAMIYRYLQEKYSLQQAAKKFFEIIASGQYGNGPQGLVWAIMAEFSINKSCSELSAMGFSREFIYDYFGIKNSLYGLTHNAYGVIHNQHVECGSTGDIDFAHMAATISTILASNIGDVLGHCSGVFNGIYSVDENAGYIGDVCGTFYASPSMENDDYKADLDAVNLAVRIQNSQDSLFDIMNEYYSDIHSYSRALEFLDNIPLNTLQSQYTTYRNYLSGTAYDLGLRGNDIEEYVEERIRTFDLFILNLQNGNNEWDGTLL